MLEIKNLSVSYLRSGQLAIKDVSFSIGRGDRVAILGPSGCGKTTLLNVLSGLLTAKDVKISGEIVMTNGDDIENSPDYKRLNIDMVFQSPTLLPWRTVCGNIAYGLEIKKMGEKLIGERVAQMVKIIGLSGFENYYPGQLSIGMQQRVNFARALVCEPELLLLDEPFSALDLQTKQMIQNEFLKILKEKNITTIFVTHSIEEAVFMSDRIIVFTERPARVKRVMAGTSEMQTTESVSAYTDSLDE